MWGVLRGALPCLGISCPCSQCTLERLDKRQMPSELQVSQTMFSLNWHGEELPWDFCKSRPVPKVLCGTIGRKSGCCSELQESLRQHPLRHRACFQTTMVSRNGRQRIFGNSSVFKIWLLESDRHSGSCFTELRVSAGVDQTVYCVHRQAPFSRLQVTKKCLNLKLFQTWQWVRLAVGFLCFVAFVISKNFKIFIIFEMSLEKAQYYTLCLPSFSSSN